MRSATDTGSTQASAERRDVPRSLEPHAEATVVHVTTASRALGFLAGQGPFMRRAGFTLHAVSSPGPELDAFGRQEGVAVHAVEMTRRMTPLRDLRALWELWRLLRRIRPQIVDGHTPKGGLLAMIAAWLARTPVRVYHLRGLPLLTAAGPRRRILRWTEWTSCRLAHRVLAVSNSMRSIAIEEGLCDRNRIKVLLGGSGQGVDAAGRFRPLGDDVRRTVRAEHGIPADALVIGFVGRLVRDKGVRELASAWQRLRERHPGVHLLAVGPQEAEDAVPEAVMRSLRSDPRAHFTGWVLDTARLYAAMDVVALPTYREGFPNVPLEAAAMSLPVVATSIPGCVDAVLDGVTGLLVPPRDAVALADALERYLSSAAMRAAHGEAGRRRVLLEFRPEAIWLGIAAEYAELLASTRDRAFPDRGVPCA